MKVLSKLFLIRSLEIGAVREWNFLGKSRVVLRPTPGSTVVAQVRRPFCGSVQCLHHAEMLALNRKIYYVYLYILPKMALVIFWCG